MARFTRTLRSLGTGVAAVCDTLGKPLRFHLTAGYAAADSPFGSHTTAGAEIREQLSAARCPRSGKGAW